MKSRSISPVALLVIAAPALRAQTAAPVAPSPVLAYQGALSGAGSPANGSCTFQFTILGPGGASLWTSGGVPVTVTNGIYAVDLGGPGMPAIPPGVLSRYDLSLEISVNGSTLSPNVPLVPALQASAAGLLTGVFSGDVGGTQNATLLLRLQGYPLDLTSNAPAAGQVLGFNGTKWVAGTLVGPKGPQGPAGPQGATGAPGAMGPAGPKGTGGATGPAGPAGHTLWNGTGAPQATLGAVQDFYLDTQATQLYGPKTSAGWPTPPVALIGPSGPAGATGATGPAGPTGPAGSTGPQGPAGAVGAQGPQGPAGAPGAPGVQGPAGTAGPAGPAGGPGATGSTVLSGTTGPTGGIGADGDFYIDTSQEILYGPRSMGAWPEPGVSLAGATGAAGAQGPQGSIGPAGATGGQGPSGVEGAQGLPGPTGQTGATGPTGGPGANGNTVLSGATGPTGGIGADGDFYIDTSQGFLYGPKNMGAWPEPGVSLAGATGVAGTQGVQGPTGPTGQAGDQGPSGVTGATGPTGPTGPTGNRVLSGSGGPTGATGNNGDYYLDGLNHVFYGPMSGGAWPPIGTNLVGAAGPMGPQGPQGPTGATGPAGAQGFSGATGATGPAGATGSSGNTVWFGSGAPSQIGTPGDFYIDTSSEAYALWGPLNASGWLPLVGLAATGAVTGSQGNNGPAGPAGPAGATGPVGATGTTGATGPQGIQGTAGSSGNLIWYGAGPPPAGTGAANDFYLDTASSALFGPKTASGWPGSGTSLAGVANTAANGVNFQRIAMLKYYTATSGQPVGNGSGPNALAFDGAYVWGAFNDGTIRAFAAHGGANTYSYNLGAPCKAIVADGFYDWVATGSNSLVKVSASTGAQQWTCPLNGIPAAMAYDGTNIWVATPGSWVLVPASSGTHAVTFTGDTLESFATTGRAMYAGTNGKLDELSLGGSPVASVGVSGDHLGLAYDGTYLWMTNVQSNTVSKIQLSPLQVVATYGTGSGPAGIVFDGTSMWIANAYSGSVTVIRAADGANLGTLTAGTLPVGIAFDGASVWVANSTQTGANCIQKF